VTRHCFEETRQVEIPLSHPGRLRDYLFTPEPVARADFFVNMPKFKAHPWTTVTFSMKNYIGIQDDRHRLIDHDHKLNEKIADLQYIIQPQFIAIDAIVAGEGRMLTPTPFDAGLIIMGNSQVAFDAVCCAIIGLDPRGVDHIRMAATTASAPPTWRGSRSPATSPSRSAQRAPAASRSGLIRVEKYFEGTNITAYAGPPPEPEHSDYCWGGCPGAIEEAIEILRVYDARPTPSCRACTSSSAAYDGPIAAGPARRSSSSATAPSGAGSSAASWCRSGRATRTAPPSIPTTLATTTSSPSWRRPPPRPPRPRPRPTCASRAARCRSPSRSWRWSRSAG
jgi:hypothetical protein